MVIVILSREVEFGSKLPNLVVSSGKRATSLADLLEGIEDEAIEEVLVAVVLLPILRSLLIHSISVSYTHLTLPTICSV